jgi:hypothetical protein
VTAAANASSVKDDTRPRQAYQLICKSEHCQRTCLNTVKKHVWTLSKNMSEHCQRTCLNTVKEHVWTLSKNMSEHFQITYIVD